MRISKLNEPKTTKYSYEYFYPFQTKYKNHKISLKNQKNYLKKISFNASYVTTRRIHSTKHISYLFGIRTANKNIFNGQKGQHDVDMRCGLYKKKWEEHRREKKLLYAQDIHEMYF